MVTTKIKALEATRAKVAALEKSIAAQLNQELASLPGRYGYASVPEFLQAVKAAAGARGARRSAAGGKKGGKRRHKRSVITEETRAEVKKLVADGKTGQEIAKTLGISLPSVQNIKKALGLVKARK